jgi:hypothetical protein
MQLRGPGWVEAEAGVEGRVEARVEGRVELRRLYLCLRLRLRLRRRRRRLRSRWRRYLLRRTLVTRRGRRTPEGVMFGCEVPRNSQTDRYLLPDDR